jgi:hypothetical protein
MTFPDEDDLSIGPSIVSMLTQENLELRQRNADLTAVVAELSTAVPDGCRKVAAGFYVRDRPPHPPVLRRARIIDYPSSLLGSQCYACGALFDRGASIVLVTLGPGEDTQTQEKWANGSWLTAVAIPLHSKCAGEP